MSKAPDDLARHVFDRLTVSGTLTEAEWSTFKAEHGVEPQQIEPVLVEVVGHLCTMAGELTAEVGRLSLALARRSGG